MSQDIIAPFLKLKDYQVGLHRLKYKLCCVLHWQWNKKKKKKKAKESIAAEIGQARAVAVAHLLKSANTSKPNIANESITISIL